MFPVNPVSFDLLGRGRKFWAKEKAWSATWLQTLTWWEGWSLSIGKCSVPAKKEGACVGEPQVPYRTSTARRSGRFGGQPLARAGGSWAGGRSVSERIASPQRTASCGSRSPPKEKGHPAGAPSQVQKVNHGQPEQRHRGSEHISEPLFFEKDTPKHPFSPLQSGRKPVE